MHKPLDGAISSYLKNEAPDHIREAIEEGKKREILDTSFPYDFRLDKDDYEKDFAKLQLELVKMQSWVKTSGASIAVVFEGRDAAGKGGTIKRLRENLNPRVASVVALGKPSEVEIGQWYFQRYVARMPTSGQITMFDRSWYNRGVVEKVFGFTDDAARETFFNQVPRFEDMLVEDGIHLVKIWLNVGRAEQLRRFLHREADPLKQWKLSRIDVEGLSRWTEYSDAIRETFEASHRAGSPWNVIRADDKRRARLAAIRTVLSRLPYEGKDEELVHRHDPLISGGPELMGIRV